MAETDTTAGGSHRPIGLAWSLAWSLSGNLAGKAGLLLFTLLAAAALDADAFGMFVALQAVALMAAVAWDLGLTTITTREIAAGNIDLAQASRRLVRLRLETAPIGVGAFVLGTWLLGRNIGLDPTVVAVMAAQAFLVGVQVMVGAALVGLLDFRVAGIALSLGRWTAALGAAVALLWLGGSALALALALCLGEVIAIAYGLVRLRRASVHLRGGGVRASTVLSHRAALPFAANSLIQMAYNRFDVLIVAAISSVGVVAAYAPASRTQDALLLFAAAAGPVTLPILTRLHAEEAGSASASRATWAKITLVAVLSSMALASATWLVAPDLVPALLGETYRDAVSPIRIIVWSVPLIAFNSILAAVVNARRRPYFVTTAIAAAAATAALLAVALVPYLGADGAAIATTLREVPVAVVLLIGARQTGLFSRPTRSQKVGSAPRHLRSSRFRRW